GRAGARLRPFGKPAGAIRWRLVATRRLWSRGSGPKAQMLLLGAKAEDAAGGIDRPSPGRDVHRGVITIGGWALIWSTTIARIEVYLGEHRLGRARLGLPRRDLAEAIDAPGAATAGFELVTNLAHWPGGDGDAELRAVAHGVGGRLLELDPVTIRIAPARTG